MSRDTLPFSATLVNQADTDRCLKPGSAGRVAALATRPGSDHHNG